MLLFNLMQKADIEAELAPHCQKQAIFQDWPKTKITGICDDTRLIGPGTIFCNTPQAHPYLASALALSSQKRAAALLLDNKQKEHLLSLLRKKEMGSKQAKVLILFCENLLEAQGKLASAFYDKPSHKMQITAITGTNGKTTIAWLLYQIWQRLGYRAAMIGTLGLCWRAGQKELHEKTGYTTPRACQLQAMLAKLVEHKIERVALEASSEGLDWGRLYGLKLHTAIFTGLSQDHLDHHKNMENYYQAKKKLFILCRQSKGRMILALQDKFGKALAKEMQDYPYLKCLEQSLEQKDLNYKGIELPDFHAWNLTLALEGADIAEEERKKILKSMIPELELPPGRFEIVHSKCSDTANSIYGIVDYAHTPDALEKVLLTARKHAKSLVCVFGCGGNRDKQKRPLMGELASRLSDMLFICDDNPRQEDSTQIIADIKKGIPKGSKVQEIQDRKQAIEQAVQWAQESPQKPAVVLVAGKGHEDYQIFKEKTVSFSDRLILQEALGKLSSD